MKTGMDEALMAARIAEQACHSDHCFGCYSIFDGQNPDEADCPHTKQVYLEVKEALRVCRRAGIEEAAKIAEELSDGRRYEKFADIWAYDEDVAKAIRSLLSKPEEYGK